MENKMKWHKFLIYFSVWVQGIGNLLFGLLPMSIIFDTPGRYRYNSSLIPIAVSMGVILLICGVLLIVVRYRLKNLRCGAPNQLMILQLISALAVTVFMMVDMDASFMSFFSSLPVILLTRYYYSKRSDLFIC